MAGPGQLVTAWPAPTAGLEGAAGPRLTNAAGPGLMGAAGLGLAGAAVPGLVWQ